MTTKIGSELGFFAKSIHFVVRGYQRLGAGRPSPCRFVPSCSNYALDALEQHGAGKGSWLMIRRIGRCNPWGKSGWDPVPSPTQPTRTVLTHSCLSEEVR
ncbi:MAG: membrane protein insertion efficiency factor YidD [Actinobacteria bacterium]|nr:membrane protein insertion efficiency factor YidD [Actinomycetota bacterium]MBT3746358.1 membrane protein insertion efficiency factor YidD [Actinomycetota bacterium]MBT4009282.1 membrane protein insertion efficiency factor YidD [Actinomycetota bacterium]MBT4303651.1 membrane protein insertion efficiency factor YidD [Actinomycetota bacterium]MBT4655712.1 membrane protein insertion efficiency factor YidD [Actinomycetota bacterium]